MCTQHPANKVSIVFFNYFTFFSSYSHHFPLHDSLQNIAALISKLSLFLRLWIPLRNKKNAFKFSWKVKLVPTSFFYKVKHWLRCFWSNTEIAAALHAGHVHFWNSRIHSSLLYHFSFWHTFCSPQSKHSTYSRGNCASTCANKPKLTKVLSVRHA